MLHMPSTYICHPHTYIAIARRSPPLGADLARAQRHDPVRAQGPRHAFVPVRAQGPRHAYESVPLPPSAPILHARSVTTPCEPRARPKPYTTPVNCSRKRALGSHGVVTLRACKIGAEGGRDLLVESARLPRPAVLLAHRQCVRQREGSARPFTVCRCQSARALRSARAPGGRVRGVPRCAPGTPRTRRRER